MRISDLPKIEAVIKNEGRVEYVILRFEPFKKFIQKCDLEGRVDEPDYLRAHPDVAQSIKAGKIKSATEHYVKTGYAELRAAKLPPTK